jgi:hypothetical protein
VNAKPRDDDPQTPLKVGSRWTCTSCTTAVVVVSTADGAMRLECCAAPMVVLGGETSRTRPPRATGAPSALLGKRYVQAECGLDILVTKGGAGPLTSNGEPLAVKEPKALPASD